MIRSGLTSCTITCAICASRSSETEEVMTMTFSCATSFADRTDRGYQSPCRRDGSNRAEAEFDQASTGAHTVGQLRLRSDAEERLAPYWGGSQRSILAVPGSIPGVLLASPSVPEAPPRRAEAIPHGAKTVPLWAKVIPRGAEAVPLGAKVIPLGDEAISNGDEATPRGADAIPQGDEVIPRGGEAVSRGASAAPRGMRSSLVGTRPSFIGMRSS